MGVQEATGGPDGGMPAVVVPPAVDRVLTVPNLLSTLRLLAVPAFLWLVLAGRDGAALLVLIGSGITDYLDGSIARRFHVVSRVGRVLDPLADRLYILSTLLGLGLRHVIPWWLVGLLLGREAFMALVLLWLRPHGYHTLPVHFVGKAATFALLYAFPLLLLAQLRGTFGVFAPVALPLGWAFVWWGLTLYWLAAIFYTTHAVRLVRADRARAADAGRLPT